MHIISIHLKGYKPLSLNNIESISIDFTTDICLLLGTNGSGKSSLLRELTPFPPSTELFNEGGIKDIVIEHNGNTYQLISTLGKAGKHTFLKNGIELLSNVTATTQRELVIKEFNYTPLVHKLLIGDLKFTAMTAQARRDILTFISPSDLHYAIKLHSVLKEAVRDGKAVLAHLVNKCSDAKTKLSGLNINPDIEKEKIAIEGQLAKLIPYTVNKLPEMKLTISDIEVDYAKLIAIKQKLDKISNLRIPVESIKSIEDLNEYIGLCSGKIISIQTNINTLTTEIDNLTSVTNSLFDNNVSVTDLQNRINIIEVELKHFTEVCFVNCNYDAYTNALNDIRSELEIVFSNSTNITFLTKDERDNITKFHNKHKETVCLLVQRIKTNESKLDHYRDSNITVSCPRCKLDFDMRGITAEKNIEDLKKIQTELNESLRIAEEALSSSSFDIENINLYQQCINKLQDVKRNIFMPFEFWENMGTINDVLQYPTRAQNIINKWQHNLEQGKRKNELQTELQACNKAIDVFIKYGNTADSKLTGLHELVGSELSNKKLIEEQLVTCKAVLKNVYIYTDLDRQADVLLKNLSSKFKLAINTVIQNDARTNCEKLYTKLADSKVILNKYDSLKTNITEMTEEHKAITDKQASLLILEEHTSHHKGVIADEMMGFVSSYISEMNLICNALWEYQLNLDMCRMENGVLEYTFPLQVEKQLVPDISDASTGQLEIINLAFVLVMRQYMGLTDYPLYLDEIGSGFDETHRRILMDYIKLLIGNKQCSQIFMINHYCFIYGGLTNHDTVVLDSRNITVPNHYNEHVKIIHNI